MGPLKFLLRFSKPKEPFPRENTGIRALEAYFSEWPWRQYPAQELYLSKAEGA